MVGQKNFVQKNFGSRKLKSNKSCRSKTFESKQILGLKNVGLKKFSTNITLHFEESIGLTNQILPGIYLNSPEENSNDE